jgi:DNA repair exonuclease SbcCD ATPase subunit
MLTFTRLNIQGFCSIDSFSLQLNQDCTVLIKAPNGFGKSTLLNALVWALYGKNIKGVSEVNTWKEYQPKDYKGTMVEVFFQKNQDSYKVIRCQKFKDYLEDGAKGNDRLIIIKNAEIINIKGKNELQNAINKELGLSYLLFMNSIMFGQGIKRLIQESNSDKKKLFEEVFDLEYLNLAKGIANQDKAVILNEINQLESESLSLKKELEANKEAYSDLRSREKSFKKDLREKSRKLKEERKGLTALLIAKQKRISDEVDVAIEQKVRNQTKAVQEIKNRIKINQETLGTPLNELVDESIELIKNKQYKKALKMLTPISKAFKEREELQSLYEESVERLDELEFNCSKYKALVEECSDIASDLADIDQEIKDLKNQKLKVMSTKYKERLKKIRKDLRKVDEDYHNRELELENYNWLINDPLGNNGIKAYLFDSSLHLLNRTLASYSEVLGFRIEFNIDLNSTRKDFVTLIERDNHIIDYDELSGGEKTLVNLCMAFAMHESLTASKGINLAFLDEVFESLSSDNIELVINLIKHIFNGKSLFLITHHDSLPLSNTKILQVEKIKGLSYYKPL